MTVSLLDISLAVLGLYLSINALAVLLNIRKLIERIDRLESQMAFAQHGMKSLWVAIEMAQEASISRSLSPSPSPSMGIEEEEDSYPPELQPSPRVDDPNICIYCHRPVPKGKYSCPNCGAPHLNQT